MHICFYNEKSRCLNIVFSQSRLMLLFILLLLLNDIISLFEIKSDPKTDLQ